MHQRKSKQAFSFKGDESQVFFLFLVLSIGILLRCWHWSSQLLLDDEWHALNFVLTRSFTDVLQQQGMGANSIPINIWTWIVLHTTGCSEALLKLPSLIASILALFLIPWLVKRLWGNHVSTVTAALLAVSPVVIFYGRIARPYAPTMLFAVVSLLLTVAWLRDGRRQDILVSAACGALAVWFHLYAAIPVCAPVLVASYSCLTGQSGGATTRSAFHHLKIRDLAAAYGVFGVIVVLLVVIPNILNPWWTDVQGVDHATFDTAKTVMTLLAGSRSLMLGAVITSLIVAGLILMVRESRIVGFAFLLPFLIFMGVASTTTQDGSHAGIQIARYGISFFPLSFIAVAFALAKIWDMVRKRLAPSIARFALPVAGMVVWLPFLATNPLWQIYTTPNNFTNHSCYQYRYDPIQWKIASPERDLMRGYSVPYDEIPPVYFDAKLLAGARGLIETPMLIGDHFNVFYYYQHFHRLPVVTGFFSDVPVDDTGDSRDFIFGDYPLEYILASIPNQLKNRTHWRTMIDLGDIDQLKLRYAGWLIVVHANPARETMLDDEPDLPLSMDACTQISMDFGNPVYLDRYTAVWRIH